MNDLRWTFEKRKSDWLGIPKPIQSPLSPLNPLEDAMGRPGDFELQVKYWQHGRDIASAGKVDLLGPYGKTLVEAAVRQYRQSFTPGDRKDLSGIMGNIIHDFPNTPLATEAQRLIDATHTHQRIDSVRSIGPAARSASAVPRSHPSPISQTQSRAPTSPAIPGSSRFESLRCA
jgi:hypothetical protein